MNARKAELLARAENLIDSPNYSKEDSSRVDGLLRMADLCTDPDTRSEIEAGQKSARRRAIIAERERALGRIPSEVVPFEFDRFNAAPSDIDRNFTAFLRSGDRAPLLRAVQGEGTTAGGGALAPPSFAERLFVLMAAIDGLWAEATLLETPRGTAMGYPVLDDTENSSAIVAENGTSSVDSPDLTFGTIAFGNCPTWRTTVVAFSQELTQDSFFDIDGLLAKAFSIRLQRGIGAHFVSTLLAKAPLGATSAAAASIVAADLFAIAESLNSAYYPKASWCMSQATLLGILGLKTTTGAFVFPAAVDALNRPTLMSFPVLLCPSMPAVAAGSAAVSFGDHSAFVKRIVRNSLEVIALTQLFAKLGQIAYFARWRADGNLMLNAGGASPVQVLQQHT